MEFIVHKHSKAEFYPIFCKWLEGHNFPEISDLILPENVFICYADEVPIYCIWLYRTDSKLALALACKECKLCSMVVFC
jgi:hypothetical protein